MARKPRQLRPEERVLWDKVAQQTVRIGPVQMPTPEMRLPVKTVSNPPKTAPIVSFRIGSNPRQTLAHVMPDKPGIAMDFKAFKKMKGGKLAPEARIDLHGLTLAQAHPRLIRFIQDNAHDGRRLVLVITGKGRTMPGDGPIPNRIGALRHQVPHWLHSMPLKPLVLQVTEANRKHGGEGAIYVYLRRSRS